jgi:hypothetical protein
MSAAVAVEADYLITRNVKDFRDHRVAVLQPGELPSILSRPQ